MRIGRIGVFLLGACASALPASSLPGTRAVSRDLPKATAAPAKPREILPFIENDYPKALADARSKKLPIFAEAWAPW